MCGEIHTGISINSYKTFRQIKPVLNYFIIFYLPIFKILMNEKVCSVYTRRMKKSFYKLRQDFAYKVLFINTRTLKGPRAYHGIQVLA